eukprot:752923-Hanusia_phi.AAC.3
MTTGQANGFGDGIRGTCSSSALQPHKSAASTLRVRSSSDSSPSSTSCNFWCLPDLRGRPVTWITPIKLIDHDQKLLCLHVEESQRAVMVELLVLGREFLVNVCLLEERRVKAAVRAAAAIVLLVSVALCLAPLARMAPAGRRSPADGAEVATLAPELHALMPEASLDRMG